MMPAVTAKSDLVRQQADAAQPMWGGAPVMRYRKDRRSKFLVFW